MGNSKRSSKKRSSKRRNNRSVGSLPTGIIRVVSGGYGFVETSEGRFFVPSGNINGAMDGDTVRVRPKAQRWRKQMEHSQSSRGDNSAPVAFVDSILERATTQLVGKFVVFDGAGYVIPQDVRLDCLIRAQVGASVTVSDGDIVVMTIETYPSRYETPTGIVERVLGREDTPDILQQIFAARNGLETEFSQSALDESQSLKLDIETALQEPDRCDIRDRFILTIDPADAKDFDDALSITHKNGQLCLGVHIADVSTYVQWGSSIDLDARRRGTSTYFPDRVIPMLPEVLSNGLCSLNPGVDRLAFTVEIMLDKNASIVGYHMFPSVIQSKLRLDYDSVQQMFDGKQPYPSKEAQQTLQSLLQVSQKLHAKRVKRGALDFVSSELKVTFDDKGKPNGLVQRSRNMATDLVEEAMILANEVVAAYMLASDAPMVYRIHDEPMPSALEEVVPLLREFGLCKNDAPNTNKQIQQVLREVENKPSQQLVNMLLLRAMKQAVYSDHFTTHFGLASQGYTHFTSPIRRYPDLMAHRLLRLQLLKSKGAKDPMPRALHGIKPMLNQLDWICKNSSEQERAAEKATCEALNSRICEYMQQFVGQVFTGTVFNVMQFGFFVRIENGCEGLVPIRTVEGWYEYDSVKRTLTTTQGGKQKSFCLGQMFKVRLVETDNRRGQLTFELE